MRFQSVVATLLFLLPLALAPRLEASRRQRPVRRPGPIIVSSDFSRGFESWTPGFSDFPESMRGSLALRAELSPLPPQVGAGTGLLLGGNNQSDGLFMFLTRKLTAGDHIVPNQAYQLSFEIIFDSGAPSNCLREGGSPGDGVFLKAGGSALQPAAITTGGIATFNLDKGAKATGGADVSVVDTIGNGEPCADSVRAVRLRKTHTHPNNVRANADGSLFLIVGTDSDYAGETLLVYEKIVVTLEPMN